jgi:hypothetical protein
MKNVNIESNDFFLELICSMVYNAEERIIEFILIFANDAHYVRSDALADNCPRAIYSNDLTTLCLRCLREDEFLSIFLING